MQKIGSLLQLQEKREKSNLVSWWNFSELFPTLVSLTEFLPTDSISAAK